MATVVHCQCLEGCSNWIELTEEEYQEIKVKNLIVISRKCDNDCDLFLVRSCGRYYLYSETEPEIEAEEGKGEQ